MAFVLNQNFTSSNIAKFWYDSDTQVLIVEYKGGAQYRYNDITEAEYNGLCLAESKGTYINNEIKSKPYQKMILTD